LGFSHFQITTQSSIKKQFLQYRKAFKGEFQFLKQEIKMNSCPECGSKKIENNHEGVICTDCGLVIDESFYSGGRIV